MKKTNYMMAALAGSVSVIALTAHASAEDFNIPGGDLKTALNTFAKQARVALVYPVDELKNVQTKGVVGDLSPEDALGRVLLGTGFSAHRTPYGSVAVTHDTAKPSRSSSLERSDQVTPVRLASAEHAASNVETVVVTSSKIKGDIQTVPIAITALSQEQLTSRQIAGGPDLVKEVPNLTFSKTNFTGYNLEIRGIGTQAISVTTDPAVAVAFNDTPFIRNHFFEQEFFDVAQVEVLRGPQGTLYGRNATAGVVNVVSAKPTGDFEAMLSADWGNYSNRRYEGMVNLPIVADKLGLRIAGEWTKRDGYSFNETTNQPIDGRDLWSSRATLEWKPVSGVVADLVWEHFSESDDRLRSGKQLCKTDYGHGATSIFSGGSVIAANGTVVPVAPASGDINGVSTADLSQGCLPESLYAKDSFQVPNGFSLPFISGGSFEGIVSGSIDPYSGTTQSTNLRDIQSAIEPKYLAKNDTLELNTSWNVTPSITLSSDTGYNRDFLWSTEDYNRFDTSPGIFIYPGNTSRGLYPTGDYQCNDGTVSIGAPCASKPDGSFNGGNQHPSAYFCDPQLGCSDRLVVQDLAEEHSWQLSQEFRLASNFTGPFNFSAGGNYLHYETLENYYVFSNTFTMIALNNVGCNAQYVPNVSNNLYCLANGRSYDPAFPNVFSIPTESPQYIDPNPLSTLNNEGHNYFVSQNPYILNSYAGFGEAYFNVTPDLKLTAGLRWTDDEKHFEEIPSELLVQGYGYPHLPSLDQKWNEWTGRFVANWTPKLAFTDQSMFYASYGRGYKAGGANPPGPVLLSADVQATYNIGFPVHPFDFKPEFIDAYEVGTKNTMMDGALTLNGDVFFYNYKGYQISQIVDRSSINLNFDATVRGAELEATYEPVPGLKFSFAGGYEDTNINNNQYAIDLIDRTAGVPGWLVVKPSVGQSSNCIVPEYVAAALIQAFGNGGGQGSANGYICGTAYTGHVDPVTGEDYVTETANGTQPPACVYVGGFQCAPSGYPGFDPNTVDPNLNPALLSSVNNGLGLPPNNGEGFAKNVGGKELPNAPHFTTSLTADYTIPVSANWAATLHGDFYWQSQSFARVFNDRPYDKIRGYSTSNVALILTDASGWQVMGYVKNIFNVTAITGDFLNSDDSGLTTNIFLTDPRLYGVRVTKHFDAGDLPGGSFDLFSVGDGKRPTLWLTLGGSFLNRIDGKTDPYDPLALTNFPNGGNPTPPWAAGLPTPAQLQKTPAAGFEEEASLAYQPEDSDWVLKAGIRYGRSAHNKTVHKSQFAATRTQWEVFTGYTFPCTFFDNYYPAFSDRCRHGGFKEFVDSHDSSSEWHAILDFEIGRNVGIGMFNGTGTISAGVRIAQFHSKNHLLLGAGPHYDLSAKYHEVYDFYTHEDRGFHGMGPELSWDASNPIMGNVQSGQLTLDWGLNAALLFGEESVHLDHVVKHCTVHGAGGLASCDGGGIGGSGDAMIVEPADNVVRMSNVTVPNLGAHLGLSVEYQNAKISFGYRTDEFFKAMDGGEYTRDRMNRGFSGAYVNLSLGFGG